MCIRRVNELKWPLKNVDGIVIESGLGSWLCSGFPLDYGCAYVQLVFNNNDVDEHLSPSVGSIVNMGIKAD
jgi:hypothetical protein